MTSKTTSHRNRIPVFRGHRGRSLRRRTLLRGACSTVLALPLLECMLDGNGEALAQGGALPQRFLQFYCPTSMEGSAEGWKGERFIPPTGPNWGQNLPYSLQPLAEEGVVDQVSAVSGLFVSPYADRPGSYDSDYHGMAHSAVLTGVTTTVNWPPQGQTADQIIARAVGSETPYPFLSYCLDTVPGEQNSSIYYDEGAGRSYYAEPQRSPAQGYRALFTGFTPPDSGEPVDDLEQRLRQSSLSYVGDQLKSLQGRLSAADRIRLDAHLTQVRALEMRLASGGQETAGQACVDPMLPDADPSDLNMRADLMSDLIAMAVACDMSRAITLSGTEQLTGDGMRHNSGAWAAGLHGDIQHLRSQEELDDANRWFVAEYAKLLKKLQAVEEGAGTALDQCAAVFVMEGGKGTERGGDGGGDYSHTTDNMVMFLGGRAGGLVPGKHVVAKDEHTGVVFNTALEAVGVNGQMGEISGSLPELFST